MAIEDDVPVRFNGQRVDASWFNVIRTALVTFVNTGTSALLTGFVVGANATIAATDSILQGFEKTQGQLNAITTRLLTGYVVGANVAIAATDSILQAFQKIQGQIDAFSTTVLSTVLTGLTLPYSTAITAADTVLSAFGKLQGQIDVWREMMTTGNLSNTSNVTFTNITELAFSAVAGRKYYLEYTIVFQSAAANTGIALSLNTSDTAVGTIAVGVDVPVLNGSTGGVYSGDIRVLGGVVTSASVDTLGIDYPASIKGVFRCTTSGTLVPQFHSEVNGTSVQVSIGSVALIREFQ